MKSYTTLRNLYGKYTKNSTTSNLTDGDIYINDGYRLVLAKQDWSFLEKSVSMDSEASQQFYKLPEDCIKIKSLNTQVGSIKYIPLEIIIEQDWDRQNRVANVTSNITLNYFVRGQITGGREIGLWPIPSTKLTDFLNFTYKRSVPDLSIADYSTGSIVSIANGATTVTGSGTTWTAGMAGAFIRITQGFAANGGDGQWYEISSVTSNTVLELVNPYDGASIAAASATYTIASLPFIPEEFQMLPVYYAAEQYWLTTGNDSARAAYFAKLFNDKLEEMRQNFSNKNTNVVLQDSIFVKPQINPLNYPMA